MSLSGSTYTATWFRSGDTDSVWGHGVYVCIVCVLYAVCRTSTPPECRILAATTSFAETSWRDGSFPSCRMRSCCRWFRVAVSINVPYLPTHQLTINSYVHVCMYIKYSTYIEVCMVTLTGPRLGTYLESVCFLCMYVRIFYRVNMINYQVE